MNTASMEHFKRNISPKLQECYDQCSENRDITVFSLSICPNYSLIALFIPNQFYGKMKIQFPNLSSQLHHKDEPYTMLYIINDCVHDDSSYSFPNSHQWLEELTTYHPYLIPTTIPIFDEINDLIHKSYKHDWLCDMSFHDKMYGMINENDDIYMFTLMEY